MIFTKIEYPEVKKYLDDHNLIEGKHYYITTGLYTSNLRGFEGGYHLSFTTHHFSKHETFLKLKFENLDDRKMFGPF